MPSAAILGGGIAGLAAAIALRRAGYTVTIYERAKTLAPIGAAISLWANAMTALGQLGVEVDHVAQPIGGLLLVSRAGHPIFGPNPVAQPASMITRAALHDVLLAALEGIPLRFDHTVLAVEQAADHAAVTFADGNSIACDLVVDASGIWSPCATRLLRNPPMYRGYGGVLGMSGPIASPPLAGQAREYWGADERFGVFELRDDRRYWFYMRAQLEAAAPPDHRWLTDRAHGWPPDIAAAITATAPESLIGVAVHARPPPRRLGEGRIICIGDAAHAMEPNLGQGACQAIEDAVALGVAAAGNAAADILPAFEAMRLKRVRAIARRAAEGGRAAHGTALERGAMRAALRWTPAAASRAMTAAMHRLPDYTRRDKPTSTSGPHAR